MKIIKIKKKETIKKHSEVNLHRQSQILADFFNGEVICIESKYSLW